MREPAANTWHVFVHSSAEVYNTYMPSMENIESAKGTFVYEN